jgi:hypothetical protein
MVDFDLCKFQVNNVLLKVGKVIRELKGLPEEKDITKLVQEAAIMLGIPIQQTLWTSSEANELPRMQDMKDKNDNFIVPRKECPVCHEKESLALLSICPTCKESENGKYHSAWKCLNKNCMTTVEKYEKFISQMYVELGYSTPTGLKKDLGIQTITDEGIK